MIMEDIGGWKRREDKDNIEKKLTFFGILWTS